VEEVHKERGYSLKEIRKCIEEAGFKELACLGSHKEMEEPKLDGE